MSDNEASTTAKSISFKEYVKDCTNLRNLLIFVYLFIGASFNFYLITFNMKYIPGDVFVNTSVSCCAEVVACFLCGAMRNGLGPKCALSTAFWICAASGVLLAIAESSPDWT